MFSTWIVVSAYILFTFRSLRLHSTLSNFVMTLNQPWVNIRNPNVWVWSRVARFDKRQTFSAPKSESALHTWHILEAQSVSNKPSKKLSKKVLAVSPKSSPLPLPLSTTKLLLRQLAAASVVGRAWFRSVKGPSRGRKPPHTHTHPYRFLLSADNDVLLE